MRSPCTRSSQGRLPFLAIAEVIAGTLEALPSGQIHSFDSLADADGERPSPRRGARPGAGVSLSRER